MIDDKFIINNENIEKIINSPAILFIMTALFRFVVNELRDDAELQENYYSKYVDGLVNVPNHRLKYKTIDIDKIKKLDYGDIILNFIDEIEDYFPNADYGNLINNINDLKVKKTINKSCGGFYEPTNNTLRYNKKFMSINSKEILYHELLHVASTFFQDGMIYSGFSQANVKTKDFHGTGINEGYTQLLVQRIYMPYTYIDAYQYEIRIAQDIERIVGQEKMQDLYFKSDLPGLVEELRKYANKIDIIRFINEVDFMNKYKYEKLNKQYNYMIMECNNNINDFLTNTIMRKEKTFKKTR